MSTETSTSDDHAFISAKGPSGEQTSLSKPTDGHRWLASVAMGLLSAACTGAIVTYFYTPEYEATALLVIENASPFVAFVPQEIGSESRRYVQSQIELMRSPVILEPALGRSEIAKLRDLSDARDRVQYLHDRITIKQVGESELYAVAFKSESAQAAAMVVNAVIAEYMNIHSGDEFQRMQRVVDVLEEERRRRGLEVERLRRRLVDLSAEATGKDPFGHDVTLADDDPDSRAAVLRERLMDIDLERETLQAENLYLSQQGVLTNEHVNASVRPDSQPVFASEILALQIASEDNESIVEQIKRTDAKWSDNPVYVRLDKTVKDQRAARDKLRKHLSEWLPGARFDRGEISSENSIATEKLKLAVLDAKRQLLSRRLEETLKMQKSRQEKLVELEFARAELTREEKVFELIANRKLAFETELRAPSRVFLRRRAIAPVEPDVRIPYGLLVTVCSAALVTPFAITIARRRLTGN